LLARPGLRLAYSAGFTITAEIADAIGKIPAAAWTPAYDSGGQVRPGAWVAEITGMLDLASWPAGMAAHRPQGTPASRRAAAVSPTSTGTGSAALPPALRAGSSLTWSCGTGAGLGARTGSATRRTPGCATCRCTATSRNQIWCEIVALAGELLAWMQMLAFTGPARRWEPKRLRLRIFAVAGRLVRGGRRLRLPAGPGAAQITAAITRLDALAPS
jgi:hypothetical protein